MLLESVGSHVVWPRQACHGSIVCLHWKTTSFRCSFHWHHQRCCIRFWDSDADTRAHNLDSSLKHLEPSCLTKTSVLQKFMLPPTNYFISLFFLLALPMLLHSFPRQRCRHENTHIINTYVNHFGMLAAFFFRWWQSMVMRPTLPNLHPAQSPKLSSHTQPVPSSSREM